MYTVTRQIGIDAGHRIATHGSKCRHLHGHRYTVEATCRADALRRDGEQTDMVLDFGFLKSEMMKIIDAPCDHGLILALDDGDALAMFVPPGQSSETWIAGVAAGVIADGFCSTFDCRLDQKLYVVPFIPTAERLARHWFERLALPVRQRSGGLAGLVSVQVWETPNCRAEFRLPPREERRRLHADCDESASDDITSKYME